MTVTTLPADGSRRARAAPRARLGASTAGCDALLVTQLANVRYLTGFTGSAALLLVLPDALLFVTDGRYGEQSAEQLGAAGRRRPTSRSGRRRPQQRDVLSRRAAGTWPGSGSRPTASRGPQQQRLRRRVVPGRRARPHRRARRGPAQVKDAGEVDRIGPRAAIADDALAAVLPAARATRPTEREFALALDFAMRGGAPSGN